MFGILVGLICVRCYFTCCFGVFVCLNYLVAGCLCFRYFALRCLVGLDLLFGFDFLLLFRFCLGLPNCSCQLVVRCVGLFVLLCAC